MVEPPFYRLYKETYSLSRYPHSIGYLGGTIRTKTDWDVMTYNADFYEPRDPMRIRYMTGAGYSNYLKNLDDQDYTVWQDISDVISKYRPSVIGISSKSPNFISAVNVAKIAKSFDDRIIVIMGGPHPTLMGGNILEDPNIDLCVRGEGELTIVHLLKGIEKDVVNETIAGISFKRNGMIINNPPREFIENLDDLCFPHRFASELLMDYDRYPIEAFNSVLSTRGCPYNCTFCCSRYVWTRRVRFRSPENVVNEINSLREMGINRIVFDDDTFGIHDKYLRDLCLAIKNESPGIRWGCEIHANLVKEDNITLMKEAGCDFISLGVESGNNIILSDIRKNITIDEAETAAKLIKKHGIRLAIFFIVGTPQETRKTLEDTMSAMRRIRTDSITYSIFTPYPGTEMFDYCIEKGLVKQDFKVELYNHQSPANCFCINMAPEEFRTVVSDIEKLVDAQLLHFNIEETLTKEGMSRILKLGILGLLKYLFHNFTDKH